MWLDAVEAVPPLPPPTLPEGHRTGRSLSITYPQDKKRYVYNTKLRMWCHGIATMIVAMDIVHQNGCHFHGKMML